jgi:hypothetical protein
VISTLVGVQQFTDTAAVQGACDEGVCIADSFRLPP